MILTAAASAQGAPEAVQLVPKTARLFVTAPNPEQLEERWSQTGFGRLLDDARMKPFLDQLESARKDRQRLPAFGFTWRQIRRAASGPATIAQVPDAQGAAATIVLIEVGDRRDTVREVTGGVYEQAKAAGATASRATLAGKKLLLYSRRVEGRLEERFYFLREGLLGFCDSRPVLTELLSRWSGEPLEALASLPAYQSVMQVAGEQDRAADLRWFIDPFGLEQMRRISRGEKETDSMRLLRQQGFYAIRGIGGSVFLAREDLELLYHIAVFRPQELKLAARVLSTMPIPDGELPDWIPVSVSQFRTLQLDYAQAFEGYGSWFEATEGEGEEGIFDLVLEDIKLEPGGPMLDLRQDLVKRLVGPMVTLTFVDSTEQPSAEKVVHAVKVADEPVVVEAARKFFQGDEDIIKPPPKIGDAVVWVYRDAEDRRGKKQTMLGPDLSNVAVTVARGHLFAATDLETLKRVLQPKEMPAPLSESTAYQAMQRVASAELSGKTVLQQVADGPQSFRRTYDLLRLGRADEADSLAGRLLTWYFDVVLGSDEAASGNGDASAPRWPGIDFSRLPDYEVAQPFLTDSGLAGEHVAQGWRVVGFSLPAQPAK